MPYGVVLKDERRTSNIERPTSNKKTNIQYRTFNDYFFSAVLILVTKILINSSVSCKISSNSSGFKLCFFMFFHSTFDVGRSMFDVHFFQSVLGKNNLALMRGVKLDPIFYPLVESYTRSNAL